MIGPIGHHGSWAVTAFSVEWCVAKAPGQALVEAPPRYAPRPRCDSLPPFRRSVAVNQLECGDALVNGTSPARRGETTRGAIARAYRNARSSKAHANQRIGRGERAQFAMRRPCAAVGPGVRHSTQAVCGGTGSRLRVASWTVTSVAGGATSQRGGRAPFGARLARIPCERLVASGCLSTGG
jgi:hypothetical protein